MVAADPGPTVGSPREAVTHRPAVELVEPPKREGKNTRYWIASNYSAFDVLGFACAGGKQLKWLQKEQSEPESETIRQFRLRDGRHALAIYDDQFYYSLVFIYKPPAEGGRGRGPVAVRTKDGSLEAWLVRHEGHEYSEHFLPLDQWRRLLSSPVEERARQANAFRMEGTAKVSEDEFGLLAKMTDIDLWSAKPLPPFTEYLDFEEKWWKKALRDLKTREVPAEKHELEQVEIQLRQLAFWRQNKTTDCAMIRGWVHAGWAPPPRSKISS